MKRSLGSRAPVISLLSPSLAASRRAIDQLVVWTSLRPLVPNADVDANANADVQASSESLNSVFRRSSFSSFLPKLQWESLALQCPETGTILHWLSVIEHQTQQTSKYQHQHHQHQQQHPYQLLAVQDASSVTQACEEIANRIALSGASVPYLCLSHGIMGRPITVQQLLASDLPLLKFKDQDENRGQDQDAVVVKNGSTSTSTAAGSNVVMTLTAGCLKEIVIPAYTDEKNHDGCTLLDQFSGSGLARPCTGLYQMDARSKLCLRPLPAAEADTRLPPPSLVFHTDSVDRIQERAWTAAAAVSTATATATGDTTTNIDIDTDSSVATAKIGYNGTAGKGQIMVQTGDWTGLDVRFCEAKKYSSMFAEAQASLQAGSLPELQRGEDGKLKNGDCWVEFRANLRHPAGFMRRRKPARIAKIPDLPYE